MATRLSARGSRIDLGPEWAAKPSSQVERGARTAPVDVAYLLRCRNG